MDRDDESGDWDGQDHDEDRPIPVFPLRHRSAWLLRTAAGGFGQSPIMSEPYESTPFQSAEPELVVPSSPLWAMKFMRHGQIGRSYADPESDRIRWASEDHHSDATVFVIEDGSGYCMVARLVGASPDGCTYCLVARIKRPDFEDVRAGSAPPTELFSHGKEFTLCGVVEGTISNVVRVAGYRRYRDVPTDYLPPSPFIEFDESI